MQQLAVEAEIHLSTMFGDVPAPLEEAVITKIAEDTDSLLQGWQQVVSAFTELKSTAFRRVSELGPLFEQPAQTEGAQREQAQAEGTQCEQGMGSSEAMEIEIVICD